MTRPRPTQVRALMAYRIWVRFSDGVEGTVDLAHLAGKGVFRAWDAPGAFERAFISSESGTVTWPGDIDLDPDVLYSQATGKAGPTGDTRAACAPGSSPPTRPATATSTSPTAASSPTRSTSTRC